MIMVYNNENDDDERRSERGWIGIKRSMALSMAYIQLYSSTKMNFIFAFFYDASFNIKTLINYHPLTSSCRK